MNKSIILLTTIVLLFFINLPVGMTQHLSIANQKMNAAYIGVDNPLSIAVSGYTAEQIRVSVDNGIITGENGMYNWRPLTPGSSDIVVSVVETGGSTKIIKTTSFRVKRIPNPIARLGSRDSGGLSLGEFKAQGGITAILENFNMAGGYCKVLGYSMTLVQPKSDPIDAINRGGRFTGMAANLISKITAGDTIYFDNIKCRCPGDTRSRTINSLVFKVR